MKQNTVDTHVKTIHKGMKNRFQCVLCGDSLYTRKQMAKHVEDTHDENLEGKVAQEFVTRKMKDS